MEMPERRNCPGQVLMVDTGNVVAFEDSVQLRSSSQRAKIFSSEVRIFLTK
jgi:uncharacterized protein (AIM24 family)